MTILLNPFEVFYFTLLGLNLAIIIYSLCLGPHARELCLLASGLCFLALVIVPMAGASGGLLSSVLLGVPLLIEFLALLVVYHHRIQGHPIFARSRG